MGVILDVGSSAIIMLIDWTANTNYIKSNTYSTREKNKQNTL